MDLSKCTQYIYFIYVMMVVFGLPPRSSSINATLLIKTYCWNQVKNKTNCKGSFKKN